MVKVKFKRLNERAVAPHQAKPGDACFDLVATGFECKNGVVIVSTGLAIQLPQGYEAQVRGRSGLSSKGVFVTNGIGTIDEGYRGEIKVLLSAVGGNIYSANSHQVKLGGVQITLGDRVAQLAIRPVPQVAWEEVSDLDDSDRGEGGFGSTGLSATASINEGSANTKTPARDSDSST